MRAAMAPSVWLALCCVVSGCNAVSRDRGAAEQCFDAGGVPPSPNAASGWAAALGAADAGPDTPVGDALCDGSSNIRLAVAEKAGGGLGDAGFSLNAPYGAFFVLDGQCHFVAQNGHLSGLHAGTLTHAVARSLAQELAVERIDEFRSTRTTCFDGWVAMVASTDVAFGCSCSDCGSDTLASSVLDRSRVWIDRVYELGQPVEGPVRALATAGTPRSDPPCGAIQQVLDWPLARPMLDMPGLIVERAGSDTNGVVFEDPADASALRSLRVRTAAMQVFPSMGATIVYVRDASVSYALYVNDVLPADREQAISAFLAAGWARVPQGPNGLVR